MKSLLFTTKEPIRQLRPEVAQTSNNITALSENNGADDAKNILDRLRIAAIPSIYYPCHGVERGIAPARFERASLDPEPRILDRKSQQGQSLNLAASLLSNSGMKFRVIVHQDEDGVYVTECTSLPGCISQGKTRKEALLNIEDAIRGYLQSLRKHREAIPPPIEEEMIEVRG